MKNHPYTLPAGVVSRELRDWRPGMNAYLWAEPGDGALYKITGIRQDWWAVTGCCSWACCPDTEIFDCVDREAKDQLAAILRHRLAIRRAQWEECACGTATTGMLD